MFKGQIVSGSVYLTTDGTGLPIREAPEPTAGEGYHTRLAYEQRDGAIWQVWFIVPDAGTAQDAAMALAEMQAAKLADDDALKVPALFPRYEKGHVYAQGDRALWQGALYKARPATPRAPMTRRGTPSTGPGSCRHSPAARRPRTGSPARRTRGAPA